MVLLVHIELHVVNSCLHGADVLDCFLETLLHILKLCSDRADAVSDGRLSLGDFICFLSHGFHGSVDALFVCNLGWRLCSLRDFTSSFWVGGGVGHHCLGSA